MWKVPRWGPPCTLILFCFWGSVASTAHSCSLAKSGSAAGSEHLFQLLSGVHGLQGSPAFLGASKGAVLRSLVSFHCGGHSSRSCSPGFFPPHARELMSSRKGHAMLRREGTEEAASLVISSLPLKVLSNPTLLLRIIMRLLVWRGHPQPALCLEPRLSKGMT